MTGIDRISKRGSILYAYFGPGYVARYLPTAGDTYLPASPNTSGIDRYIQENSGILYVNSIDGIVPFYPTVSDFYLPKVPPNDTTTTPPPPIPDPSTTGQLLVNWMIDHIKRYAYSQASGRLTPDASGYTDCSGLVWYCYQQITGQNIGTWTGDQQNYGTEIITTTANSIDESIMQLGDLVFFDWGSYTYNWDHVEMYMGSNQTIGHGGPGYGPTIKNFENNVGYASRVRVRRYV